MSKKKKILFCFAIIMLIIFLYEILNLYALFQSDADGDVELQMATWSILVNDTKISDGIEEVFYINNFSVEETEGVATGKLAPGTNGYFDIVIDPTDTSVSIMYEISIDLTNLENENINITSVEEITNANSITYADDKYTGIIKLSEIESGQIDTVRIYVEWENDEQYNEEDTAIGLSETGYISLPIVVTVTQYLGE